jgi:succinate dehydrogenase/fumarate reductase flavoprotein subunit
MAAIPAQRNLMMSNTQSYDVVVVGGGGSGLAAAAEAASGGAKVLLIEKNEELGGTTAWSVGAYTTSASPHQKRAGIEDSPEQHFADMDLVNRSAGRPDNLGLRRILTYEAPDTLRWLMSLGIEFVGPNPEPPHTKPRMHNVVPGATSYIYYVSRHCRRLGVDIKCSCKLIDLVFDGERCTGVEVEDHGVKKVYRAGTGVILAAGDFSGNRDMRARFFKPEVVNAEPVNRLSNGDGIIIGERHGGRIVNGDYSAFYIPRMRFVPPVKRSWVLRVPPWRVVARFIQFGLRYMPPSLMRPFVMRFITTALGPEPNLFKNGAALVNVSGKLIDVDVKSPARNLALDESNKGYIIFDSKLAGKFEEWPNFVSTAPGVAYAYLGDYRAARKDIFHQAATLGELADKISVSRTMLENAVAAHNARSESEIRQQQAPFYALGPVRGYLTATEGGLAVTDRLEVLGSGDRPIPGLYAAGSCGQGGVLLDGHGHHISWAFISGRYAARSALGILPAKGNA